MDLDLGKIVKIYRVAKATNTILEQKELLSRALRHQKKSMDAILDVADIARRTANADLTGEDVRNTARAVWNHGPRVYAYVVRSMRKRSKDE